MTSFDTKTKNQVDTKLKKIFCLIIKIRCLDWALNKSKEFECKNVRF